MSFHRTIPVVMDTKHPPPGDLTEYGSRLDVSNCNEDLSAPYTPVLSNRGPCQTIDAPMQFSSNFCASDLHGPINYPMTMATVTSPIHPSPVPSDPPRSNIVGNAQLPPCDHPRYTKKDKPPRRGVVNADIECANCGTKITSAWRRSAEGESECNACNLFFRKNGRKRPFWMRRDIITRRYRLSRCKLCEAHAKCNPTDYGQIHKAVTRHCQNDELSSEGAVTQHNIVQPSDPTGPQSTAAQNSFVPSNAASPRALTTLISSSVHYNTQNPMVMSYATERCVFSALNIDQHSSPSVVSDQISFTEQSHSAFFGPDVFGHHMLTTPPNLNENVVEHDAVKEKASPIDQNTGDRQNEAYQSFVENAVQQELVGTDMLNDNPFEDEYEVI
ncbi:hypothetical protein KIN20_007941 [Parelaphostrongylus tenuis]|uniref:GATA-type domain-containing protein n=1 Tax=Parelaphostrongylus tenuis TaxID=148309 RepID=A0AAD5MW51_PARTN|nr:hypothetical protein KIN20_007941 [Parelaphostrongylus tenuis]